MKYLHKVFWPDIVFTLNGLVSLRILDTHHKPYASIRLYFLTIGLALASYGQKPKVKDWKTTLEIFNEIQL